MKNFATGDDATADAGAESEQNQIIDVLARADPFFANLRRRWCCSLR